MRRKVDVTEVAGRPYWREAEARVVVESWRRSGEPLSGYARRCRVDPKRIARWASRLGKPKLTAGAALRFHPVRLADDGARQGGFTIEIELPYGRRVRVAPGFDPEDLWGVVAVLEAAAKC
jgi:hypothetical protein